MKVRYSKSVRLLSECFHAFEQLSGSNVRGEAEFARLFMPHIAFCKQSFDDYREEDFAALGSAMAKLKACLGPKTAG